MRLESSFRLEFGLVLEFGSALELGSALDQGDRFVLFFERSEERFVEVVPAQGLIMDEISERVRFAFIAFYFPLVSYRFDFPIMHDVVRISHDIRGFFPEKMIPERERQVRIPGILRGSMVFRGFDIHEEGLGPIFRCTIPGELMVGQPQRFQQGFHVLLRRIIPVFGVIPIEAPVNQHQVAPRIDLVTFDLQRFGYPGTSPEDNCVQDKQQKDGLLREDSLPERPDQTPDGDDRPAPQQRPCGAGHVHVGDILHFAELLRQDFQNGKQHDVEDDPAGQEGPQDNGQMVLQEPPDPYEK